jgi:hypothetical protein
MILTEAVNAAEVSYISDVIYGRKDGMALTVIENFTLE